MRQGTHGVMARHTTAGQRGAGQRVLPIGVGAVILDTAQAVILHAEEATGDAQASEAPADETSSVPSCPA